MRKEIIKDFKKYSSKEKTDIYLKFFKTEKGQYGYGDIFLGLDSPTTKSLVKKYKEEIYKEDILYFLKSKIHEHRAFALEVLKYRYSKGSDKEKSKIVKIYLDNVKHINNWDLVDISSHHILGDYLMDKDREVLYKLANSDHLWSERISIISTFAFIRNNDFKDTLKISKILLKHEHDLIHKAVGWMLREIYKRDNIIVENFIKKNYKKIPRTTLRYAIEKMDEDKRQKYLKGDF